ncbi:MAG: cation diffusion facilitator family transporter [Candidatus Omnitrophica bacterium]|jgi:cation diffusion facilitator family transporter|nr:cation diffusion facilitator family transporter [Candidatus Omnitrophota bacterium]
METNDNKYKTIRKVLIIVLILNWLVAGFKIAFGLFTRCASMTADGFHSLADGASNIIGLAGIHFASQPKDSDHPYGHKKFETFFTLGIAVLLFLVAIELFKEGIARLGKPVTPEINFASFIVMISTMIINILVMLYERNRGKKLSSDILTSDALHTKADIFVSFSVIITLILIQRGFFLADAIVTLAIAFLIAYSGIGILKESSRVLCDSTVLDDKYIEKIVLSVPGVRTCHKIRTRGRTDDVHVDLHVQVTPSMHVDKAHTVSDTIEETLKKTLPGVTDVIVHIEPTS